MTSSPLLLLAALLAAFAAAGCSSSSARIAAPDIDPAAATKGLLQEYDADHDGMLIEAELAKFQAVKQALSFYDGDRNGVVSAEELEARLQSIVGVKVGLMPFFCRVDWNGSPLAGAKVELIPEPALAAVLKPAEGTTDAKGNAQVAVPDAMLPESDRGLSMMMPGLYRVKITHPTQAIPAQFNTSTTLGQEVGDSLRGQQPVYALHSQ